MIKEGFLNKYNLITFWSNCLKEFGDPDWHLFENTFSLDNGKVKENLFNWRKLLLESFDSFHASYNICFFNIFSILLLTGSHYEITFQQWSISTILIFNKNVVFEKSFSNCNEKLRNNILTKFSLRLLKIMIIP